MENILSVSVLVFQDDSILFINSGQGASRPKLVLPGGKPRENENIENCAVREVKEAAGIDVVLDKKLSGVITRQNKHGNFIVTFVFLAEAVGKVSSDRAVYIPHREVESYDGISEFSKLIIRKLKLSTMSGMDKSKLIDAGGKEYLMYF